MAHNIDTASAAGRPASRRRRTAADEHDRLPLTATEQPPTTLVRIASLVFDNSPRRTGEDPDHTRLLAETAEPLPPIAVHRPTMRVIDGMHRARAAMLTGRESIDARLYDCSEDAAYVLAVKANVTHGLPLSLADRRAAAKRIIRINPQWSDRAVAAATGLSDKTVSGLRRRSTAENPQSNTRIGRDGRARPLNNAGQRHDAAKMLNERPGIGLREVARATGLSVATASDVRDRLRRHEDPVPPKHRCAEESAAAAETAGADRPDTQPCPKPAKDLPRLDRLAVLANLRKDPSLRLSEGGRHAVRWLYQHTVQAEDLSELVDSVPPHWTDVVAELAHECAEAWAGLADELKHRGQAAG